MSGSSALIASGLFLLGNAFFVGAEFAVVSARRAQIEPRAEAGSRLAKMTLEAMEKVSLMLAMCQLGITVCSLGLGKVSEKALAEYVIEPAFHALHLPDALVHPIAFAVAMSIVVYLHVVAGEMIPKNISLAMPEQAALILAPALLLCSNLFKPLIVALNWLANGVLRVCGIEPKDEVGSAFTAEQVQNIVAESHREGLLDDDPTLLTGALAFSDHVAATVMVPLEELAVFTPQITPAQVEQRVLETGFSRFPVLAEDSGAELVGYLHFKDVLYADEWERSEPVPRKRFRTLVSVQSDVELEDALAAMQRQGAHLGRVVDDQGHSVGVIFMEDVLEQLVGEISDESASSGKR